MARHFSIVLLSLLSISLYAQNTATIAGLVTDPSGAAVEGAKVTVVNTVTPLARNVESNASGQYVVPSVPTGAYTVSAVCTGFQKLERSGIEATAASTIEVNLQLTIGSEAQSVLVTASAPLLQSQT